MQRKSSSSTLLETKQNNAISDGKIPTAIPLNAKRKNISEPLIFQLSVDKNAILNTNANTNSNMAALKANGKSKAHVKFTRNTSNIPLSVQHAINFNQNSITFDSKRKRLLKPIIPITYLPRLNQTFYVSDL